jgi:hypothetical protein
MRQQYDKQEIAQLLNKFMAGETSIAEEETLAQYFRTHEVDDEWTEYKEMFTLFDNGEVDIEIEDGTSEQPIKDDSAKIKMLPKTVREKPKIVTLRWLMAGIAASIVLLAVFHLGRSTAEQPSLVAEKTIVTKDSIQPKHEAIAPAEKTVEAIMTQVAHAKPQTSKRTNNQTASSASSAENLADCIARLESEMEKLDDSVSSAQVERLIAADARLQEMVYRIVGKQAEEAMNKIQNDSTANYISF